MANRLPPPPFQGSVSQINSPGSIGSNNTNGGNPTNSIAQVGSGNNVDDALRTGGTGGGGAGYAGGALSPEMIQWLNELYEYAQGYTLTLDGDVVGSQTVGDGTDVTLDTSINLPNIICIDGGDATSTYPGEAAGPYGVLGGSIGIEDEGSSILTSANTLDFVGAGVTVTDGGGNTATVTISGGGGGSGAWTLLNTDTISGSPSESTYTWDETSYSDIRIVITGIQPATDGTTLRMQVGHTNGSTYWNSANDYDGVQMLWESGSWSAMSTSSAIDLLPGCSNAANETVNASLEILGGADSNIG